ncbi:MAG: alpha/beta fold hydrolase, partial [Microcella sp.]
WDMPGYGASDKRPEVPLDLRTQAVRLSVLVERWALRRPHVIAHDIGGAVALRAHLMRGTQYADLFLWDVVTLDPWGSAFFRLVAEHGATFAQLPGNLHAALVREYIRSALVAPLPDIEIDRLAAPWLGGDAQAAFYRQIAELSPDDTRDVAHALDAVRCPVRIGWGADDPWIPVEQAFELRRRLPDSPLVDVIEGAGHLTPREDAEAVIAAVRRWLQR